MSELSGQRVVGKRPAPQLDVVYQCMECGKKIVLDAYQGPPSCSGVNDHLPVFMKALRIARDGDYGVDYE